jgi:murein L,D-transpeptidase YafK
MACRISSNLDNRRFPENRGGVRLQISVVVLILAVMTPACGEKKTTAPGPERAAAAAARVRPLLEPALSAKCMRFGDPVFIRAFKEEMELELFIQPGGTGRFVWFKTYPIARSSGDLGPKLAEGDGQVPEGFYFVPKAAMKPDSTYHLAFNLGYPNACDRHHGRTGSHIMIHGSRYSIGCLAMTDPLIEEIYSLCDAALVQGQRFFRTHVFPFRMTDARMKAAAGRKWEDFWKNLKEGYDLFEKSGIPPEATVADGKYQFGPH